MLQPTVALDPAVPRAAKTSTEIDTLDTPTGARAEVASSPQAVLSPPGELIPAPLPRTPPPTPPSTPSGPVHVHGKFFDIAGTKFIVRGVTYGPLCAGGPQLEYRTPDVVARDFELMKQYSINSVRTYTVPPKWFLDTAAEHGLRVMVGLAWEQHVAFLESTATARRIESEICKAVASIAGHPALFAYTIGNEIPSTVVRWYGHRRIEKYLQQLHQATKQQDPTGLVTYVNYPSTEYLELPFLDFLAFNVFLENPSSFGSYLARLQTMAGNRPLLMSELGLDGKQHGPQRQARSVQWQVRKAFRGGCAGLFVFSWTDEWHRGGEDVVGWEFGLTTRDRKPKPALELVGQAFANAPFHEEHRWPGVSVVICSYNGSANLRWCLEGVCSLHYPSYEIIVVDDGSTDNVGQIAAEFASRGVRLISTPNRGLSSARNEGLHAATQPIVAFLDDDARPDPQWLMYLADSFQRSTHVGIGGPNIPPPDDCAIAHAVAMAPGGPVHVLLTDEIAEHIPGCNMAFMKQALLDVGGFDPQFRIAGDDVDLCWRLQAKDWTLGFNPAAMVWHRRRGSVRTYWRQQFNYGRAEADLERKWPEKYNAVGHLTWAGRLYRSNGLLQAINWWARRRIYHGTWGGAMFQSVYHAPPNWIWTLPTMPEWYLLVGMLAICSTLGRSWMPLYFCLPLAILAAGFAVMQAMMTARSAVAAHQSVGTGRRRQWVLTGLLHVLQPLARLCGRISRGLTPWRSRGVNGFHIPRRRWFYAWDPNVQPWRSQAQRLHDLETTLIAQDAVVSRGGDFDRWDLEVRGGVFGSAHVRLLVEEHGGGGQFVRVSAWPRWSARSFAVGCVLAVIAVLAAANHAVTAPFAFALAAWLIAGRAIYETGAAMCSIATAAATLKMQDTPPDTSSAVVVSAAPVRDG